MLRDFTPKGKLWAADNKILIGQAIRISIARPDTFSFGQSVRDVLNLRSSAYLPEGRRPQLFCGDPSSFRITESDAALFDGYIGAFISANDHVLVGFTNGLEFMFSLHDIEICKDRGFLTEREDLPDILFCKNESIEKMNKEKYPGEIAFYDSLIVAMIRDGASDADCLHRRTMALVEKRRKLFNENI